MPGRRGEKAEIARKEGREKSRKKYPEGRPGKEPGNTRKEDREMGFRKCCKA